MGDIPTLIWNEDSDWAVPLPEFNIGQLTNKGTITAHCFIPDETPIIPTGWEFRINGHWFNPWQLTLLG
jgi:hypothetical protein